MKKFGFLFLLLFLGQVTVAQLDVLHYIPPLYGRTNVQNHYIVISTPSTGPVDVTVKRGDETLITSVTITDIAPATIFLGTGYDAPGIIGTAELNTVNTTDGFIVEGTSPIYVNLRHVQSAQGLSLTSKGIQTGLGTRFRSGHIYSSAALPHVKAHMISVMAYEDGTTVTFSDISPGVIFRGTPTTAGTSDDITVVLNAGESYVIAAWVNEPGAPGNVNDVNGTLVTSDKPITCNTGSWLSGAHGNTRDIGVDQLVSVDLIDKEYIFIEGDGNENTERPLIVAEYDGTQIFVNDDPTPYATINAGEYLYLPQTAYSTNDNIYIRTTEDVFMYQSLSGASPASTSLNFIPPLRCNGFKKVVIPSVNLVGVPTVSITARRFADVFINGSTTPLTGGQTVPGNDCWLTYRVPGGTGDFVVESDSIINVALLTLQGPRGSAGYFTGFAQFTELDRGDTTSFVVCGDEGASYTTYSIAGPYLSITAEFFDPSLGGAITIDGTVEDTINFTYSRPPGITGPDSLDLTVCKLLECCGAIPDTICETSTIVFTNIEEIDVGLGDSIVACADTSSITLEDLILGTPEPGGYWVDVDGSGALIGDTFDPSLVPEGVYNFTYYVDGGSICYDSTVVTVNVLPMSSSSCCSISPDVIITDPTCNGLDNGAILITDTYADLFSIDAGTTTQPSGNFDDVLGGSYDIQLSFGPDCIFDSTIVVNEPDALAALISIDSVSCNGECDATLSVTSTTGGTPTYVYSLGGGPDQTSPDFIDLCAGTTTLTITDDNGCELDIDTAIFEPDLLLVTEAVNDPETCGDANGSLTVGPIGGTSPYTYTLDGGAPQTSPTFNDLPAGDYTIEVTDGRGCTDDIVITIVNEAGPVPFVDVLNNVTCNGGLNGSVIIGVTDGTAPLSFVLDGGIPQASNTFPTVGAGPHTVVVTDANGCTGSVDFVITEPTTLTYTTTVTNVSCFGACDGEIDIDASGATPPYTYSDDGGATFFPFDVLDDLCAGDVLVVVRDDNGCLANSTITITEPDELTASFTTVDPDCHGTPTGEIDLTVAGGVLPYTYSTDGGTLFDPTEPIVDMFAGDYDVVVEDGNGCQVLLPVTLVDPPPFTFTFVSNDPSNCGADDGSFEMIATGGTAPYEYSIDGGTTLFPDGLFEDLFSGLYTLYAVDADGCIDSTGAALSDNEMTTLVTFTNDATCFNDCDGSAGVGFAPGSGGTAPFTFEHSYDGVVTSSAFPDFFGLCEGTHFITITDAGDCISIEEFTIGHPDTVTFDPVTVDITCPGGADGEIDFGAVTGGDGGAYTYSIDGGGSYVGGSVFTGLTAGTYVLFAQDGNGCLGTTTVTLTEPDEFEIFVSLEDVACNGDATGVIQVVADGANGPTFTYTVGASSNTTGIFTGLTANSYTITIEDGIGCTIDSTVTISEPPVLTAAYAITNVSCNGECDGEVAVTPAGGVTPYLYSSDGGVTIISSGGVLGGLCAGDHDIYLEDDNGCIVISTETITEPDVLEMTLVTTPETCDSDNATVDITGAGGTPAYLYSVDGGAGFVGTSLFTGLSPIYYDLVIQDFNGCEADSTIEILADPLPNIVDVSFTDPLCFGGSDGSITIISDGGVGAHEYSISSPAGPYQASNTFTGLFASGYTVYVRDANGCVVSLDIVMDEPEEISLSSSASALDCFQDNSGVINMSGTGGTLPYQFSIDNGATFTGTGLFEDLAAGTYDIVIEDANGCQIVGVANLFEPPLLEFDVFTTVDASCYGFCDGEVYPNVVGGTAPYNYIYSGDLFGETDPALGACAGLYSLVVTDVNGCSIDTLNFEIGEPDQAVVDSVLATPVTCFGDSDGVLEVYSANAGFYSIGGPFTASTTYPGLISDTYWVYVQDVNGCPGDSMLAFVPTPLELMAFVTPDEFICPGDTVYPSIVATGGTAPYFFDWNLGSSTDALLEEIVFSDTMYYATVTDVNGCSYDSDTMFVTTAPPPVLVTSNDTTVCPGETIYLSSYADDLLETYLYDWETGETGPDIYPTINSDTMFVVTVTDECLLTTNDTIRVDIYDPPVITLTPDVAGGCVPFQVNYAITADLGLLGSDFSWSTDHGTIDSSNFTNLYITYNDLGEGVINLSFTSAFGCEVDTTYEGLVEFYDPPVASFVFNPESPTIYDLDLDLINQSINNDQNFWIMFGDTTTTYDSFIDLASINPDSTYNICLMVRNDFGCEDMTCQPLQITQELFLFVPNAIIINGVSDNGIFKPVTNYFDPDWYSLQVFNRWGELIFETDDVETGWDGTHEGVLVPDGVYVWKIKGAPQSNPADLREYYGHVTVLK
ncbi:MAG: gliding motility-associated C-terminal domain-containing protein [Crocinitomicaceae bacterium]|nr:gliding motility-associated C-terminal domain-containing protein [Crocinitomicaceae bacterium]